MYNLSRLFKWNPQNNNYSSPDNLYENVFLHTGKVTKGLWESSICVSIINNEKKILSNSNHFLHHIDYGSGYNSIYKIYDNIVNNYNEIINNMNNQNNNFDNTTFSNENITYFYMINAFSFSNSGHDLSILLDMVDYILKNHCYDQIL